MSKVKSSRRGFLESAAAGTMLAGVATAAQATNSSTVLKPGATILFQGDSSTDAGRKRGISAANRQDALGQGYAFLAAAELLVGATGAAYRIHNRRVSGDGVHPTGHGAALMARTLGQAVGAA